MRKHTASVWDGASHLVGPRKCHSPLPTFVPLLLMSLTCKGYLYLVSEADGKRESGAKGRWSWRWASLEITDYKTTGLLWLDAEGRCSMVP